MSQPQNTKQDKSAGITAALIFLTSFIIGGFDLFPHVKGLRETCAILAAISLTATMVIVFKDWEKNNSSDDSDESDRSGKF